MTTVFSTATFLGAGNFHVNFWFHLTGLGWNTGLKQEIQTLPASLTAPTIYIYQGAKIGYMGCNGITHAGVGRFRVNPRFHATYLGWNLGLTWKLPTPTSGEMKRQWRDSAKFVSWECLWNEPSFPAGFPVWIRLAGGVGVMVPIVCQMFLWWAKKKIASLEFINIWDMVTKVVPFCSVYLAPSFEPTFALLAPFFAKPSFCSMLFILELACTVGSAGQLKNKWHA